MSANQTAITVVIPTRERADTLYHCLRTVVSQNYENFEIVVSDNHSGDGTEEVVKNFRDARIRYVNPGVRLSMSEHWEFALSHVSNGWVSILGDDDGLLPGALARVDELARETRCSAITSTWCNYFWPESTAAENRLTIPMTNGWEKRDGREWLSRLMRGNAHYSELPWLYTGGFVEKRMIDRARSADGRFFCSMIPDVYSAIALASTIGEYVALQEPISVVGISSHSNGASQLGRGRSNASDKFFSESNIPFHPVLGSAKVKSIPIMVFECYLQAETLHRDFLAIELVDQLGLALARAQIDDREELRNYCEAVANRNGIPMSAVNKRSRSLGKGALARTSRHYLRAWQYLTVNAKDFFVSDVYGAALLSAQIYRYENQYKNWRWHKVGRTFSRALGRRTSESV
jgi:glycosyltransferase involved in cell wall biosynthesis